MKVLLIEDDALMRKMISKTITSRFPDIEYVECQSVPEAKAAYDSGQRFDFALVDFELIEGTGYDVVNYIRVEKGDKLLPIMMCTSHQDRKTVLKMLELGVNDYLAKPFQPKKIIDKVERLVERGNKIRETLEKRKQVKGGGVAEPAEAEPAEAEPEEAKPTPPAPAPSPPKPEEKGTKDEPKKGSVRHGNTEGVIDDSDDGAVEYIDLKKPSGDDDDAHVEVSDDMFLT